MNLLLLSLLGAMLLQATEKMNRLDDAESQQDLNMAAIDQIGKTNGQKALIPMNCLGPLTNIECYLEPQDSNNLKSTSVKLKNLQTSWTNLVPNQQSVKVFRNVESGDFVWHYSSADLKKMFEGFVREELETCFRLEGNNRANCIYEAGVHKWLSLSVKVEIYQFAKKVVYSVMDDLNKFQRREASEWLLRAAIDYMKPDDVMRVVQDEPDAVNWGITGRRDTPLDYFYFQYTTVKPSTESTKIARILLAGADAVEGKYFRVGRKLLHAAASSGDPELVALLLEHGVNVDAEEYLITENGRVWHTPLMIACINGNIEIVKILIAAGANEKLKSGGATYPFTAAELAKSHGHQTCADEINKKQIF